MKSRRCRNLGQREEGQTEAGWIQGKTIAMWDQNKTARLSRSEKRKQFFIWDEEGETKKNKKTRGECRKRGKTEKQTVTLQVNVGVTKRQIAS